MGRGGQTEKIIQINSWRPEFNLLEDNMRQYIIKRFLIAIPTLFGMMVVIFLLLSVLPGDPAELIQGEMANVETIKALRKDWGLDEPVAKRFVTWLKRVCVFDFGNSLYDNIPVLDLILERFPNSAYLGLTSLFLSVLIGIPLGVLAATHQNTKLDYMTISLVTFGQSMPVFWLGLLLMLAFGIYLDWLPIQGMRGDYFSLTGFSYVILPAVTIALHLQSAITRMTRSSMLEVIRSDYILTARSKGLTERIITWSHAFPNALIPVITVIGLRLRLVFSGVVLTETLFSWPGVGLLLYRAVEGRDYPVIQGTALFVAMAVILINLLVDITYALVDPRIVNK